MPYSSEEGKQELKDFISQENGIRSILDVGAGAGTYYDLLRDVTNDAHWDAIEVWEPYISRFNLSDKYNNIINKDAITLDWPSIGDYDIIIFGDVLEHMTTDDARSIIRKAIAQSKMVVISVPIIPLIQGAEEGNPYETHLAYYNPSSVLNELIDGTDIIYRKEYSVVGVYVLRGNLYE